MTRKEEIDKATGEFGLWNVGEAMFKLGTEWADEHPRKGLVDIEKACEWLESSLENDLGYYGAADFVDSFRKAMEGIL